MKSELVVILNFIGIDVDGISLYERDLDHWAKLMNFWLIVNIWGEYDLVSLDLNIVLFLVIILYVYSLIFITWNSKIDIYKNKILNTLHTRWKIIPSGFLLINNLHVWWKSVSIGFLTNFLKLHARWKSS